MELASILESWGGNLMFGALGAGVAGNDNVAVSWLLRGEDVLDACHLCESVFHTLVSRLSPTTCVVCRRFWR